MYPRKGPDISGTSEQKSAQMRADRVAVVKLSFGKAPRMVKVTWTREMWVGQWNKSVKRCKSGTSGNTSQNGQHSGFPKASAEQPCPRVDAETIVPCSTSAERRRHSPHATGSPQVGPDKQPPTHLLLATPPSPPQPPHGEGGARATGKTQKDGGHSCITVPPVPLAAAEEERGKPSKSPRQRASRRAAFALIQRR